MGPIARREPGWRGRFAALLAALAFMLGFGLAEGWNSLVGRQTWDRTALEVRVVLAALLGLAALRAHARVGQGLRERNWVLFLLLFGIGPGAEAWLHQSAAWLGLTPPAFTWAARVLPLTLATLFGALALAWCSGAAAAPPQAGRTAVPRRWGWLALLVLCAASLRLGVGAVDAWLELRQGHAFAPLEVANPWLRLRGLGGHWGADGAGRGLEDAFGFMLLLTLREGLRLGPLWWWMWRLRQAPLGQRMPGRQRFLWWFWPLFVLGEFCPLLLGAPVYSASWLLLRTGLGLARAALLASLALWWSGPARRSR